MTEQKQPEALRLAQFCRAIARGLRVKPYIEDLNAAAALLERQYTEIESLQDDLAHKDDCAEQLGRELARLALRLRNYAQAERDWAKGYGLLFKQNGQLRDLIELMFSSTMPYDKSGQPTFSDAIVNLWSNLNQVDSAGPSACYDEPQPAPGAGDQVQMILKHRLMRKVEGDWLAASEFMTGEPDPSWLAKTGESPEEWRIEQGRRVSGEQIQAGLTRAFASWKKPAPAGEHPSGAIVNGRTHIECLEATYQFECEAGPLSNCKDWQGLKRCFEYLIGRIDADRAMRAAQPASDDGWLHSSGMLYRLTDERRPKNRDEINVTMADGSRSLESRSRRALELLGWIRAMQAAADKKEPT